MHTATHTAADQVREAFAHWGAVPELTGHTDVTALRSDYEAQSGPTHWFDPDTLRFFGSRNRAMAAPGLLVEFQANAPEGCGPYAVTAWVLDPSAARDHRPGSPARITPKHIAKFATRAAAVRFARAAAAEWPTGAEVDDACDLCDAPADVPLEQGGASHTLCSDCESETRPD